MNDGRCAVDDDNSSSLNEYEFPFAVAWHFLHSRTCPVNTYSRCFVAD